MTRQDNLLHLVIILALTIMPLSGYSFNSGCSSAAHGIVSVEQAQDGRHCDHDQADRFNCASLNCQCLDCGHASCVTSHYLATSDTTGVVLPEVLFEYTLYYQVTNWINPGLFHPPRTFSC